MLRGRSAVVFVSSVSSGAASSRCLLGLRRRLSPLLSLRGWTATTACSPSRLRASWTHSSLSSMPQQGSSATGGSMTTSHRSSAMFSTGCQFHSASSTSSVYSSSYHFTELLQSTCAIAALGLIPPRLGYVYDHLRRPIFGCGGCGRTSAIVLSLPPVLGAGTVFLLLFVLLTQLTHLKCSLKLTCSLRLILFSCLRGALVAVWPRYCDIYIVVIIIIITLLSRQVQLTGYRLPFHAEVRG